MINGLSAFYHWLLAQPGTFPGRDARPDDAAIAVYPVPPTAPVREDSAGRPERCVLVQQLPFNLDPELPLATITFALRCHGPDVLAAGDVQAALVGWCRPDGQPLCNVVIGDGTRARRWFMQRLASAGGGQVTVEADSQWPVAQSLWAATFSGKEYPA